MPDIDRAAPAPTAIKVVSESADTFTLGGHAIVFGGKDLVGDHFTADTDVWSDRWEGMPILYEHGLREPGRAILGKVSRATMDPLGWWVEAEIRRNADYAAGVLELAKSGALGWSTGAVSHLVEREPSGRLKSWPVAELSATPVPAEPRTLGVSVLKALDGGGEAASPVSPIEQAESLKVGRRFSASTERSIRETAAALLALLGDGQEKEEDAPGESESKSLDIEGRSLAGALSHYGDRLKAADAADLAAGRDSLDLFAHALSRAAPELAIARRRATPPEDIAALRAEFAALEISTGHIPTKGKETAHAR